MNHEHRARDSGELVSCGIGVRVSRLRRGELGRHHGAVGCRDARLHHTGFDGTTLQSSASDTQVGDNSPATDMHTPACRSRSGSDRATHAQLVGLAPRAPQSCHPGRRHPPDGGNSPDPGTTPAIPRRRHSSDAGTRQTPALVRRRHSAEPTQASGKPIRVDAFRVVDAAESPSSSRISGSHLARSAPRAPRREPSREASEGRTPAQQARSARSEPKASEGRAPAQAKALRLGGGGTRRPSASAAPRTWFPSCSTTRRMRRRAMGG